MGGQVPGPIGTQSNTPVIDAGTLARVATPRPGLLGIDASRTTAESPGVAEQLLSRLRQSSQWLDVEPVAVRLLGPQSFGLGVVHGMGLRVLTDIIGLAELLKTLILADMYDQVHARGPWQSTVTTGITAFSGPLGLARIMGSKAAALLFEDELAQAAEERDQLIAALGYALSHPKEIFENIGQEYLQKWRDFEQYSRQQSLSSQFKAGQIFGEVLLEVLLLFATGVGLVKLAAKVPQLAKAVARLGRITKNMTAETVARLRRPATAPAPSLPRPAAPTASELMSQQKASSSTAAATQPGLHNQSWNKVDVKNFKTHRQVDMRNLSAEDDAAVGVILNQGRTAKDAEQLLSSGEKFRTKTLQPGDKLYGFDSQSNPHGLKSQGSMYWTDEAGYQDVKSKFYNGSTWDREGVKNYLALPCYNRADVIDTATVTQQQTVVESTIGKASEQLGYTNANQTTGMLGKIMPGGGTQITPNSSAISTVSRLQGTP